MVRALPPPCRRGLILVDPPYELDTEYNAVPIAVLKGLRKFATGVFVLWYPVVDRSKTEEMLLQIKSKARLTKKLRCPQLRIELGVSEDTEGFGMTACGLWIVNPPWQLDSIAEEAVSHLKPLLCDVDKGHSLVRWEVSDDGCYQEDLWSGAEEEPQKAEGEGEELQVSKENRGSEHTE